MIYGVIVTSHMEKQCMPHIVLDVIVMACYYF